LWPCNVRRSNRWQSTSSVAITSSGTQKRGCSEEQITFKGYKRHASKEEPQYIIKSDKTDHLAIHKGSALKKIKKSSR
jgi:hypothetical protein